MAKVHPQSLVVSLSSKVFTVWMKSLILSSNGCAVFDSNGGIVYRVDNYNKKCSREVHVMDGTDKLVLTIVKKKFGMWEGYTSMVEKRFRVREVMGIRMIVGYLKGYSLYKLVCEGQCEYMMKSSTRVGCKLCCTIVDNVGALVAEVKRKRTKSGVVLMKMC